jgi:hypothetical protein
MATQNPTTPGLAAAEDASGWSIHALDELQKSLYQLCALLAVAHGDTEQFSRYSDQIKANYLWACSNLAEDALRASHNLESGSPSFRAGTQGTAGTIVASG